MRAQFSYLRVALSLALVVSAALFALGGSLERSDAARHYEAHATAPAVGTTAPAEADGGHEGAVTTETATATATTAETAATSAGEAGAETTAGSETLLGVDPESVALTVVGVVLSLLLAAGAWLPRVRGRSALLLLIAASAFGLVFAAGDGRELAHQLGESNSGLAALAAVVLALHLVVAGAAAAVLRAGRNAG